MKRTLLGIISLILLFLGIVTLVGGPGGSASQGFAGSCIRMGLVLGALWLALPQITAMFSRMPRWLWSWMAGSSRTSGPSSDPKPKPQKRPRRRSNA